MLVGPATEPARKFRNFLVPVYPGEGGRRLLPGAPISAVQEDVQEFLGSMDWLDDGRWPSGVHKECLDRLARVMRDRGFAYCLCIPVLGNMDAGKELVGIINVNTKVVPELTTPMRQRIYEMLKPLLVLLGWIEAVRRGARRTAPNPKRR